MKHKVFEAHTASVVTIKANLFCMSVYLFTVLLSVVFYTQYVAFIPPLVLFFLEKKSYFVRFHMLQASMLALCHLIVQLLLSIAGALFVGIYAKGNYDPNTLNMVIQGTNILGLVLVGAIIIFSFLAIRGASNYQEYRLPLFGRLAKKYATMRGNR